MRESVLARYALPADVVSVTPYGNGHINKSFRVCCADGNAFLLQRINTEVFLDPEAVMRNIELVTAHLRRYATDAREVLSIVPTRAGASFCVVENAYWRMFPFVQDCVCIDHAETPEQFAECATGFATFFNRLRDFDASQLTETILQFHDTPSRFLALQEAVNRDTKGRVKLAKREIAIAYEYEAFASTLADLQGNGVLPLRVTHNDTKINNILFDKQTGKSLCVVDLDTVMPGLIVNDFGDAIRYGASTAAEDERDIDRVAFDLAYYEAYLSAFVRTCGKNLSSIERMMLPTGAKMMTYETGIRFLTDYLSGDSYFHIAYPEQNLHRARTQLKLVQDMDAKWDAIQRVTKRCLGGIC